MKLQLKQLWKESLNSDDRQFLPVKQIVLIKDYFKVITH